MLLPPAELVNWIDDLPLAKLFIMLDGLLLEFIDNKLNIPELRCDEILLLLLLLLFKVPMLLFKVPILLLLLSDDGF